MSLFTTGATSSIDFAQAVSKALGFHVERLIGFSIDVDASSCHEMTLKIALTDHQVMALSKELMRASLPSPTPVASRSREEEMLDLARLLSESLP